MYQRKTQREVCYLGYLIDKVLYIASLCYYIYLYNESVGRKKMVSYAKFNYKTASLASDFGFDLAVKWFGEKVINELPKFKKGKKVGKTKGSIVWKKVFKGGWVRTGSYDFEAQTADGYVEQRVNRIIGKCLLIEAWGGSPEIIKAEGDLTEYSEKDIAHVLWM